MCLFSLFASSFTVKGKISCFSTGLKKIRVQFPGRQKCYLEFILLWNKMSLWDEFLVGIQAGNYRYFQYQYNELNKELFSISNLSFILFFSIISQSHESWYILIIYFIRIIYIHCIMYLANEYSHIQKILMMKN